MENLEKLREFDGGQGKVRESLVYLWFATGVAVVTK